MQKGFSLVELSIVLVILGLLVGGIMTGQNLIRASELRSITVEYENYQTAVGIFKDKYFALPGDMPNATKFWGAADTSGADGECANPGSDAGTGTQTCNGDGNGQIGNVVVDNETYRFWQHLANAGMVSGQYDGLSVLSADNIPASKMGSNIGWAATWFGYDYPGGNFIFQGDYGNLLGMAATPVDLSNPVTPYTPFISPEELWNIDTKMDDGKPGQGRLVAGYWNDCTNADDHTEVEADYLLSESGKVCYLIFREVF